MRKACEHFGLSKLFVVGVLALCVSGCAVSQKTLNGLAASQTVAISVTAQKPAWKLSQLPPRPGAGAGAISGMGAMTGEVIMSPEPEALLLLPILLPVGALIGAASVPDDREWALIERKYDNLKKGQTAIYRADLRRSRATEMEQYFVEAFRSEPAARGKCVTSPRFRADCRGKSPVAKIAVHMMPEINNEGYSLNLVVRLQTPSGSDCFVQRHSRYYSRDMSLGRTAPNAVLGEIRRMEADAPKSLAYQLLEILPQGGRALADDERSERRRRVSEINARGGFGVVQDDAACG